MSVNYNSRIFEPEAVLPLRKHYVRTDYGSDIPEFVQYRNLQDFKDLTKSVNSHKCKHSFASMLTQEVPYTRSLGMELYRLSISLVPLTIDKIYNGVRDCPYANELKVFLLYVYVYQKHQMYDVEDEYNPLLSLLEGPAFAERLKKRRTQYMLESFNGRNKEGRFDNDSFFIYERYFPPKYCFLWQESNNDFEEWSYVGHTPGFNPMMYDQFETTFRTLLDDFCPSILETIADEEISLQISGQSSFFEDGSRGPEWLNAKPVFSNEYRATLQPIMKNPTDSRDIVILSRGCKLTLQRTNFYLKQLLRYLPYSAMNGKNIKDQLDKFLKRNKHCWFYMRDLRKEGLTKPHAVLKSMYKVLKEKYPTIPWDGLLMLSEPHFYDSNNNELKRVSRGHGLGMANEATTIMQIIMHCMLADNMPDDINVTDALYYNDDSVIAIEGETIDLDSITVVQMDLLLADSLDILINDKKSFVSPHSFVFCEEYYSVGSYVSKKILKDFYTIQALTCENIQHAKRYISALPSVSMEEMANVLQWWGYEFNLNEVRYPYLCGGWFKPIENGLDQTLIWADNHWNEVITIQLTRAITISDNISLKNRYKGRFEHPAIERYGISDIIWNSDTRKILLGPSNQDAANNYLKLSYSNHAYTKYWQKKAIFVGKTDWSKIEWFEGVLEHFPGPFSLPQGLPFIKELDTSESFLHEIEPDKFIKELVQSKNSILSYLSYLQYEGYIKSTGLDDKRIPPNKYSLMCGFESLRKRTQTDSLFTPEFCQPGIKQKTYLVNAEAVLSMLPLTRYPEVVIDDYIMRYNAIPLSTLDHSDVCFGDTRIPIECSMLESYYTANITWTPIFKKYEVIVYCVDPLGFNEAREECNKILSERPKEKKIDPIDERFNYYKDLADKIMIGDSITKWCYELAVNEPNDQNFTEDWDTLMYAWDHKEVMHAPKELEEAYFAFKKFMLTDYYRLSGDWNFKSQEEKLEIARGFAIGPYLKTLQPVVTPNTIADEVWLAWGLDPPEEEDISLGFGSDDDLFW